MTNSLLTILGPKKLHIYFGPNKPFDFQNTIINIINTSFLCVYLSKHKKKVKKFFFKGIWSVMWAVATKQKN